MIDPAGNSYIATESRSKRVKHMNPKMDPTTYRVHWHGVGITERFDLVGSSAKLSNIGPIQRGWVAPA